MEIDELIMKDLAVYGQDNPCPKSLTVVEGKLFRHYELGEIYGFCVYNHFDSSGEQWFGVMSIEEDDEYWFIPSQPMNIAAAWIPAISRTWERTKKWYSDHIIEGWRDDENFGKPGFYVHELKKPLKNEVIMFDGEPDNAVIGTKYLIIDNEQD